MPAWWDGWPLAVLWRTSFDSLVAGVVVFSWTRHLDLPSGAARRQLLALTLCVPLVTGVVASPRLIGALGGAPWLDTYRILALPIYGPIRVYHLVAVLFAATVVATLFQEILPAAGRLGPIVADSRLGAVRRWARALDGWEECEVQLVAGPDILVATSGRPSRPRLHLSLGTLDALRLDELEAVIRHEHAHWRRRRWLAAHLLFVVRLLQIHNPLALWLFREYTLEAELACDAEAAGERREELARALLVAYRSTARGELATRARLRKRVDVLRGEVPYSEAPLPATTVAAVGVTLLLVLPWIV